MGWFLSSLTFQYVTFDSRTISYSTNCYQSSTALGLRHNCAIMAVMKTCCGCFSTKSGTFAILLLYTVIKNSYLPKLKDLDFCSSSEWKKLLDFFSFSWTGSIHCMHSSHFYQSEGWHVSKMVQRNRYWFRRLAKRMYPEYRE